VRAGIARRGGRLLPARDALVALDPPRGRPLPGHGARVRNGFLGLLFEHDELAELDPAQRRLALRRLVAEHSANGSAPEIVAEIADYVDGYGPLTDLMCDEEVSDVLVNGPHEVWVERAGELVRSEAGFRDEADLRAFVDRLVGGAGGRVDASFPIADARLRDGSRIHVVMPPVAPRGPLVSLRRFPSLRFDVSELAARRMLTESEARFLGDAVASRLTIAISGATGSGKTTLMNALLAFISSSDRVVIIEETPELNPGCPHIVSLVARQSNIEGRGAVEISTLVRAALRMRPDRIVIGEIRGPEALTAMSAMATGHEGSMITLHSRSAADAVERVVTLALQADSGARESTLRAQASQAFDLIVHLERRDGRRQVVEIIEVT
jgi:pilus assembly protein CpaF